MVQVIIIYIIYKFFLEVWHQFTFIFVFIFQLKLFSLILNTLII